MKTAPPRLSWSTVQAHFHKHWKAGQHLSVIAPTEYGKSYVVVKGLLPMWDYTLTLDIKGDGDPVVASAGKRIKHYPSRWDLMLDEDHHYVVSPGYTSSSPRIFGEVLREAWHAGRKRRGKIGWLIYVDETLLAVDEIGLGPAFKKIWIAGRSAGMTLVASNQAATGPKVPQQFYNQPRWHIFGNTRDDRVLYRISEIGAGDKDMMRAVIPNLDEDRHELLIVGPGRFAARTIVGR